MCETWACPLCFFVCCVHIKKGMALYSQQTTRSINHLLLRATSSRSGTFSLCGMYRLDFLDQSWKRPRLWSPAEPIGCWPCVVWTLRCELLENVEEMCQIHPLAVHWILYASYPRWPLMHQANLTAGDEPESPSGVMDKSVCSVNGLVFQIPLGGFCRCLYAACRIELTCMIQCCCFIRV